MHHQPLGTRHIALYGSLALPFALMQGPGLAILPNMYAERFGIALTQMAVVMLVTRLVFDALGSVVIGAWSDRTRTRWGRRKPWIVTGALLGAFGVIQLYTPGADAGSGYLAVWIALVYVAWNMVDVPYTAWGNELTRDHLERSGLSMWRQAFNICGVLAMALLPLVYSAQGELDWDVLRVIGWSSAVLLPLAALAVCSRLPHDAAPPTAQVRVTWRQALRTVAGNRPFAFFVAYGCVMYLGAGVSSALFFLYYANYLGLAGWFPLITASTVGLSLLAMPLWMRVLKHTSKNRLLLVGTLGMAASLPLAHFIEPGPRALPLYMAYDALWWLFYSAIEVSSRALLGDIIDYDTLKTRRERAGEYVALWTLLSRGTLAVAGSLGFAIAGLYGYDPSAATPSDDGIFGLKLTMGGAPALMLLVATGLALLLPLTRRRHDIVRRRLERRAARQRPAPPPPEAGT